MVKRLETPADQASRLGARARERRRELGLTQQELADLASVGVRSVHELEHGKATIRFEIVSAVMTSLGLTLDVVITPLGGMEANGRKNKNK